LRNGGRPWLRFDVFLFVHLARFKKFPSQKGENESFFRPPTNEYDEITDFRNQLKD
jgi:hypothetical protein